MLSQQRQRRSWLWLRAIALVVAVIVLLLTVGCKNQDNGVASVLVVGSVEVAPPSGDLVKGQTLQLTATPKTDGGIVLPGRTVVWSSSDESRATVSSSGMVQAVALGGPVRIRATVSGVPGDAMITVVPLPVDHITVSPPTSAIMVGQTAQLTATAFDASGATLANRPMTWTSGSPGTAGVTSTGLVMGAAEGGPVIIMAAAEGKSGTATVTVSRRPASRLGFVQQPGPTVAGAAIAPAVRVAVQDDLLGTIPNATTSVSIGLVGNPGGATLGGTLTASAVNGIATFSNLTLDRVGSGYTLLATADGLTPATSTAFNVTAGSASKLAFVTAPPSTAQNGVPLSPAPALQVRDNTGNPVSQAGLVITASIASGTAGLGGTMTATTGSSGGATFGNLTLSGPAGTNTITFSASGMTAVTSGPITLAAGAPARLVITTQPSASTISTFPFSRQPVIQLVDASGNPAAVAGVSVTASINSCTGLTALGGTRTVTTDASGVAAYTDLSLTGPGSCTLKFTAPGLIQVISSSISVL